MLNILYISMKMFKQYTHINVIQFIASDGERKWETLSFVTYCRIVLHNNRNLIVRLLKITFFHK